TATTTVSQNIAPPPVQIKPAPRLTCTVKELSLEAVVGAQTQLQWATQNGHLVSGGTTAQPKVDEPGLYLLTVTSLLNGCTSSQQVTVEEEQNIPTGVDFKLQPPLCTGKLGIVSVEQIQGGIGPFRYSIDGGQTFFPPKDFDKLPPGDFLLVIQDANGCEVEKPISVPPPPKPAVSLPPGFKLELGDEQELIATVPPSFPKHLIDTVLWVPLEGLTFAGSALDDLLNPTAKPLRTTEYMVTLVTPEGCKVSARTLLRVDREPDIYVPNVIRPDDPDGDNSVFRIYSKEESVTKIRSLQVYDRWGTQVFLVQDMDPKDEKAGWGGDFKGSPVNPAVFAWWAEVELIDGRVLLLKGDVTVVR
ncbi:MAG TPA: gliding motility-associated C-terminal domain-containing protein, partial [Saprospiraceae bacterium]|nr:gliding motility-associated C-terminal domain-containing protein [Saprospiraceae bacterium]